MLPDAPAGHLLRLRGDHLAPDYQPGDVLSVRRQEHADEGALAVVRDDGNVATVRCYRANDGLRVVGVVVEMWRRL